jgi:Helix-turn-helix domain
MVLAATVGGTKSQVKGGDGMSECSDEPVPGLLSCAQLAARWGVHPGTVRNWVARGVIPGTTEPLPFMKVGQATRFSPAQVAYIESRMTRVAPRGTRRRRRSRGAA